MEDLENLTRAERKARRQARRDKNQRNRQDRKDRRAEARNQRKNARISKRNAKKLAKIYGDMTPEEANALNEIQPYVGAMKEELKEKEIPIDNEDDEIEIANKWAQNNDEVENPMDDESFDNIYVHQNLDDGTQPQGWWQKLAKGALTFVGSGVAGLTAQAKEKKAKGEPLTKTESALLEARNQVIKDNVRNELGSIFPIALILILILRK